MKYIYNKIDEPNLLTIHNEVLNSVMNNKSLEYCTWDEDLKELEIVFINELNIEDKNILDLIIEQI